MQVITDLSQLQEPPSPPTVLTMGDFDGIHRGHRALLECTTKKAHDHGLTPALLTFDPSPKKVLDKLSPDDHILTKSEKELVLERSGIELAVFLPFTLEMSQLSARRYLKEILLGKLNMRHLVVGYDHHFGRNRRGNYRYLSMAAPRYGFAVEQIEPVTVNGRIVSSSAIRKALETGDIKSANQMLGLPYFICGKVTPGMQRGRTLGFPTANLLPPREKKIPRSGVYFGATVLDGYLHRAVINVGRNPTFNNTQLTIEAHLPGFSGDLYGKEIILIFLQHLRDEKRFESVEQLKAQIASDINLSNKFELGDLSFFA